MAAPTASHESLRRRAVSAWYRRHGENATNPFGTGNVVELDKKTYVLLYKADGVLAVYRVRNDGQLKLLRRWPTALKAAE